MAPDGYVPDKFVLWTSLVLAVVHGAAAVALSPHWGAYYALVNMLVHVGQAVWCLKVMK